MPEREDVPAAVPGGRAARGREGPVVQAGPARRWSRASSRCTSGACTSGAACRGASRRSGSSARATARSTTRVGEKRDGPAPRGLDRFVVTIDGGDVIIDTERRRHRSADRHEHHGAGAGRSVVHLTPASSVAFVVWKSDLRHFIVLFNILALLAIGGYLAWSVFSREARRQDAGEPDPLPLRRRPRRPATRACARLEPHVRHDLRGGDARLPGARTDPAGPLGDVLRGRLGRARPRRCSRTRRASTTTRCSRSSARTATAARAAAVRRRR